jgi:hypothetical protein
MLCRCYQMPVLKATQYRLYEAISRDPSAAMDRNVNAECKEEPADDNHMDHHASANAHDTEDFQLALIPPRSLSKSMREARSIGGTFHTACSKWRHKERSRRQHRDEHEQVFPVLLGLCMKLDESTIGAVIGLRLEQGFVSYLLGFSSRRVR